MAGGYFKKELTDSKIHMESKRTYGSQNNFEKEQKVGGLKLPNFQNFHKATNIKIMW